MRQVVSLNEETVIKLKLVQRYLDGVPVALLHADYCKLEERVSYPVFSRELKELAKGNTDDTNS